jgi:hypothetical protein
MEREEDLNFYANMGFEMLSQGAGDDDDDWDHECGYGWRVGDGFGKLKKVNTSSDSKPVVVEIRLQTRTQSEPDNSSLPISRISCQSQEIKFTIGEGHHLGSPIQTRTYQKILGL